MLNEDWICEQTALGTKTNSSSSFTCMLWCAHAVTLGHQDCKHGGSPDILQHKLYQVWSSITVLVHLAVQHGLTGSIPGGTLLASFTLWCLQGTLTPSMVVGCCCQVFGPWDPRSPTLFLGPTTLHSRSWGCCCQDTSWTQHQGKKGTSWTFWLATGTNLSGFHSSSSPGGRRTCYKCGRETGYQHLYFQKFITEIMHSK